MAKSNFVHHRNANGYCACCCSSRCTSIGFDCRWKNFPVCTKSMTISSPGRDSERFFVCLFVCVCLEYGSWSICIYSSPSWMWLQDAFLWLQEEKVLGGNTVGNTKTHLHLICLQTSPQHYISFVWFLFSSEVGLFCSFSDLKLLDTLFVVFLFLPSAIVVSLFWFQASSCRRIYWGIIGWAYKSMLMILPAPSFIGNQCIFSSFL